MLNFPFSAALLAGGQSRRMGRDKAGLTVAGEVLWKRQLAILKELRPAQLFICARRDAVYPQAGCKVITDIVPDAGPLGGLVTALRNTATETLLLLAVDMPAMEAAFLETLLKQSHEHSRCVIPQGPEGLEPLAAVYRTESLAVAEDCLNGGKLSMRSLVSALQERRQAELYLVQERELPLFRNVNTPEELAAVEAALRNS